ncbi:hypothetical protein Taro_015585 [Colocasia esculenta]|uniref:Uncharacterized protein n=1 Tax=Colocasia esculenta TaxID=4460 RepID=A0A843UQA8_COLES|nr:hypothetical protein [Colocasia esculenta]
MRQRPSRARKSNEEAEKKLPCQVGLKLRNLEGGGGAKERPWRRNGGRVSDFEGSKDATVIVRGNVIAAETDENFICATLDWWPPDKCNYNQCPWGNASVLNLDLHHPFLAKAIQGMQCFL